MARASRPETPALPLPGVLIAGLALKSCEKTGCEVAMRRTVIVLAAAAAVAIVIGCNSFRQLEGKKLVKAEYYPKKRKMLVIPFKDQIYDYFESPEGRDIADYVGYFLRVNNLPDVRTERNLVKGAKAVYDQNVEEKGELEGWKALAELYNCELVLVGQIEKTDFGGDRDTNVAHGQITLSAQLYDIKNGGNIVWQKKNMEVQYPEGWENEMVADMDMNRQKLRTQVLKRGGEVLAECFFDHVVSLLK